MKKNSQERETFNLDVPSLLEEITNAGLKKNMGVLKIPMNLLQGFLHSVAKRASELDDPELNILMLRMRLYAVETEDVRKLIEEQRERLMSNGKETL